MASLEMDVETSLPPERVKEAFIDFSKHRPAIWPDLDRSLYEVYSVGDTAAEVKEGSRFPGMTIWAKEHYDWSDPATIRWTVAESNFCTVGSYAAVTLHPTKGGGTRVHIEWDRTGTTFGGKVAIRLIRWTKGKPVRSSVQKALHRLEQTQGTG